MGAVQQSFGRCLCGQLVCLAVVEERCAVAASSVRGVVGFGGVLAVGLPFAEPQGHR